MTTSTPLMRRRSWYWIRSLSSPTCPASSSRVIRLATVLMLAPRSSSCAAAARSAGVVEEKVKAPVSS